MFDEVPEVLTRGHVLNQRRIFLIQERASFSQYLVLPTKFSFSRIVRIYSYKFSLMSNLCMKGLSSFRHFLSFMTTKKLGNFLKLELILLDIITLLSSLLNNRHPAFSLYHKFR